MFVFHLSITQPRSAGYYEHKSDKPYNADLKA